MSANEESKRSHAAAAPQAAAAKPPTTAPPRTAPWPSSVAIAHATSLCSATEMRWLCSDSQLRVLQLASCSYCTFESWLPTASAARFSSLTTAGEKPPKVSKSRHITSCPCDSEWE